MSAHVGSPLWRSPALTLVAALLLVACAPAQEHSPITAASKEGAPVSAEQTLTRARALQGAGRFAESLEPLETYLASDPRNTVVRLEHARTLAILRRFQEAAREYRRVLETEPQNPAALIGLAKVAAWQGQNQLALETYDRVLARNPGFYDALVGKAFLLVWMGRKEDAQALFREAQRQHPEDSEVRQALASLGPVAATGTERPAAGDAAGPAPVEAPKPAATPPSAPSPVAAPPGPSAPAATVEGTNAGEMPPTTVAAPAWLPDPQPIAPPQHASASVHAQGTRERAGVRTARVEQRPSATEAPADPPPPQRIAPLTAAQLAMLGIVAVVVGAVAYRKYNVRHSEALLPRRAYELPPASLVPPPRPVTVRAAKEGSLMGRVLVVHPQQAVREFAHQVLAGAGAEVLALGRGEDAMVRLDRAQYDAIVISDQLPAGWSGREIYRWLAQNQPGAERKFVLALAGEADEDMQLFLEESGALTISTPFGVSDLLAMTRLAIARSRAQA